MSAFMHRPALTALLSPVDHRDYQYVPKDASALEALYTLRQWIYEHEDQLTVGACVSNSFLSMIELMLVRAGVPRDLARMAAHTMALDYENRLAEDGVVVRSVLKILNWYGAVDESAYPYDVSKAHTRPPDSIYLAAASSRVLRYEAVVPPAQGDWDLRMDSAVYVDRIKRALKEGLPVSAAFLVNASFYSLSGPWQSHQYNHQALPHIGAHQVYIVGWDDSVQQFECVNSWGQTYGDGGFFGLPYSIAGSAFFEAWVIRNFAGVEIPEPAGVKLELLNRFRCRARHVPTAAELGTVTNYWMAARAPNGDIYVRRPIPLAELSHDEPAGLDLWDHWPSQHWTAPPTVAGAVLNNPTIICIVQWGVIVGGVYDNLARFSGVEFFLLWGETVQDAVDNGRMVKVGKVPVFL